MRQTASQEILQKYMSPLQIRMATRSRRRKRRGALLTKNPDAQKSGAADSGPALGWF